MTEPINCDKKKKILFKEDFLTEGKGVSSALEGIKVLDLSRLLAGPYCAMMLADMGAEILKVEPPQGEDSRQMGNPPQLKGESFLYLCANRNKKAMTLDLRKDEGKEILKRLVRGTDVIVENFLPDVKDKLGINYEWMVSIKPNIIYCSLSSFGQEGPYKNVPGLDVIFQAMGGLMSVTGEPEGIPMKAGAPVADMAAAFLAAFGIMTALFIREKTGIGQKVEVSLLDSLITVQASIMSLAFAIGENPLRLGTGSPVCVPSQTFKTKDRYIAVSVFNEKSWARLCKALGIEELIEEPKFKTNNLRIENRKALIHLLEKIFLEKESREWLESLKGEGIACAPVSTYLEVFSDPQIEVNEMIQGIYHPLCGRIKMTGIPVKLSRTPGAIKTSPPLLSQHTQEVLLSLGYTEEEIEKFKRKKII